MPKTKIGTMQHTQICIAWAFQVGKAWLLFKLADQIKTSVCLAVFAQPIPSVFIAKQKINKQINGSLR